MNEPIFMMGETDAENGTCTIPPSILSQIDGDLTPAFSSGLISTFAFSEEKAKCTEYNTDSDCALRVVSERISCNGKISSVVVD